MKPELTEFFSRGATHALTLKPNAPRCVVAQQGVPLNSRTIMTTASLSIGHSPRLDALRNSVGKMMARVQKKLFGKHWSTIAWNDRVYGWASVEGLPYDGHVHMALVVPPEHHGDIEKLFPAHPGGTSNLWSRFSPGGTTCLEPISAGAGWTSYMAKRLARDSDDWFEID